MVTSTFKEHLLTFVFRILSIAIIFLSFAIVVLGQGSWRTSPSGFNGDLVAIYFTSSERGFVAGDGGYLASTIDGGRTWQTRSLNMNEDINEIYFRNEKNGYLVAGRKLFITSDAGETWRETDIYQPGEFRGGVPELLSIRFADKKRGLAIGSVLDRKGENVLDSLVMRTTDGGETWQRIIVPFKAELFHLDFNGSSHGWIVGDHGIILATTDGGDTWRVQRSGTERALYNVDFRDDDEGYAVGGKGTILRTKNGGAVWEKVETPFTATLMRVDFADDENGWVVGHGGLILRSSDRGRTWTSVESRTKRNLYGLYIVKKYGWAVGSDGTMLQYQK